MANLDAPLGGVTTDEPNGSWVPISNNENSWISIGPYNTCQPYDEVFGESPPWGITGEGNEELSRHVMCCEIQTASGGEEAGGVLPTVDQAPTEADLLVSSVIDEAYNDAIEQHAPVAYNRENGWVGQTYKDAVMFCSAVEGAKICPYVALCPLGPHVEPLWGYEKWDGVPVQTWAPISDTGNDFVQLSAGENACVRYSAIHDTSPDWGDSSEQITRNVVCCKGSVLGDAEESFVYQTAATTFHPIWYNRLTGYMGQTYQDAVNFCSAKSSQTFLCPYEACECISNTIIPIFLFRTCFSANPLTCLPPFLRLPHGKFRRSTRRCNNRRTEWVVGPDQQQ
jgi:hypothetical protein